MSNLPPNPYNNFPGPPQVNANAGPQAFNHSQPVGHVPLSQLPPGYGGIKQDPNSNSPHHVPAPVAQNSAVQHVNNYSQSASSSPAFNQSGMMSPVQHGLQSSPMRPPMSTAPNSLSSPLPPQVPLSSGSPRTVPQANPSPTPYPPNYQPQQRQINDNAPPLIPSSQMNQPLMNGPPMPQPGPGGPPLNQYPGAPSAFSSPPGSKPPVSSGFVQGVSNPAFGPPSGPMKPPGPLTSQPNVPFSNAPLTGPPRNSPLPPGPPVSGPPVGMPGYGGPPTGQVGPPRQVGINGPHPSGPPSLPPSSEQLIGPPRSVAGGLQGPISAAPMGPPLSGPPMQTYPGQYKNGPSGPLSPPGPSSAQMGPPNAFSGPQSAPPPQMPMGPQSLPPMGHQMGPPPGPIVTANAPKGNMQNRYPQMAPGNYVNHQQPPMAPQQNMMKYPQQYGTQALTQQMGQLSVTKQGFDQLWGHHMVDLLQCKHILPEYPEDPPEIKLGHQFAESPNCSPEIFRCTVNRIPETNSLLQKSRLPLGILIHPFKDLNHLPVIQCTTIVRCRACRTYINPFVYFVDAKRWKCNLCYRVNDLPEEFQYDPVSKSYGDPSRRPEIKSATIEFIAPGEYMLRPPQPAVYLFLFDVSQLARESGYLQVVCDTLKTCLDQLPGDARTQIGFICYDAHVHYYLMSEGLTRPKEMTVLDIDDVFLPSPSSLLVNLGERRELVRELLAALPQRYSAPAAPACALGAALQAAYKLMAPTGGRITVFQTCLPNVGPGALQPREDPNARSSKDVAHLNPATDFYKRLALDCSGAQIAVDLFLLNSQYADLATLSGMSKFSAGTVYHIPLFRAVRQWQAEQLNRMFTRYLTRKIGFEAVMRVRCTRGITIHTFHGNFFVRSTDLLSLPNVSPDAGFGMQLTIEESLADLQQVCFQAALLYTSSKGERRIRVHTLALPTASSLSDVLHSADQQCIIGLLSKMAVDRCQTASMGEAREAVMNVAVDALSAFRLAQNLPAGDRSAALHAPASLRLLPLYLLALLKRKAFRTGTSTRLDDRVADMCALKCSSLAQLMRAVYPALYCVAALAQHTPQPAADDDDTAPDPPQLQLTAERINSNGAYLLDDGESMILYVCHAVSAAFLSDTFGVAAFSQLPDEMRALPRRDTEHSALLHAFIDKLNDDRPYAADILVLRDNSPNRTLFTERLIEDRVESAFSYYEFLQHVKTQVK
ncbi:protein transport protein Sec24AB [Anticarsia gemmatalis]|uniref:protein transport protein Sec24AB n=1 Tax=Anticarsia gemmatalis TaxID=129554 RepID=UPI003F76A74A